MRQAIVLLCDHRLERFTIFRFGLARLRFCDLLGELLHLLRDPAMQRAREWSARESRAIRVTEVVALRDNSVRPGRRPTGLAVLRVQTRDQDGRPVLDYHRCAMLPMRSEDARPATCVLL